jgi:hypothetical protein
VCAPRRSPPTGTSTSRLLFQVLRLPREGSKPAVGTARCASGLKGEPRAGKDGKPLPVTQVYGADVGKVVAESDALEPSYTLTGKELYVRARVTSSKPHPNPFQKGDVEAAWTQPVLP